MEVCTGWPNSARSFAWHDELGLESLKNLATLVQGAAKNDCNAAIGPRARRHDLDHFAFNVQGIARSCRGWPVDLSSRADNSARQRQPALDIETHRNCSGVPAACSQALEECVFGGLLVGVEGLRIKLNRERLDLRFVNRMGRA